MRAELANLNHCAVPFLSRAAVNLSWYYSRAIDLHKDITFSAKNQKHFYDKS